MTKQEFYDAIAKLLDTEYTFSAPYDGVVKKRWYPRHPGNGRFPGRGVVRWFGPDHVQVALYNPPLIGTWREEQVFDVIANAI